MISQLTCETHYYLSQCNWKNHGRNYWH